MSLIAFSHNTGLRILLLFAAILVATSRCIPVINEPATTQPDALNSTSALDTLISIIESTTNILQPSEPQENQQILGERFVCLLHKRADDFKWKTARQHACEHFLCLGKNSSECSCSNASIEAMCANHLRTEIRDLFLNTEQPLDPVDSVNTTGFSCNSFEDKDNLFLLFLHLHQQNLTLNDPAASNLTREQRIVCILDYQNQVLAGINDTSYEDLKSRSTDTLNQLTAQFGPITTEKCHSYYRGQVDRWIAIIDNIRQTICPQ